ncbi:Uu.00g016050.m01.CDS01 [Anthostomella pinea]|uniref:Uu.00g016050.m01.CDS01 n=1 Tax=Anthostomella pinea TaxID=933095 RepID=A0AAI8VYN4_9PEZI|nr:Uu.00g016050.m01.CDS01 [Anthostomella pinea]
MTTASPTPAGPSHSSAPTRKSSLRSGLRRGPSRPQLNRAESNPGPTANSSQAQYAAHDSSDDEIPVPMKLSALTKALLNDGGNVVEKDYNRARTTRAQSHRPSSPVQPEQEKPVKRRSVLNASIASIGEERRHTRANSAQLSSRAASPVLSQPSKESSPLRKRVVRLSTTSQGTAAAGSAAAAAQFKPAKRRSTSLSASQSKNRPPSRDGAADERGNASELKEKDINTPGQQGRLVRIALGSSGNRGQSAGSVAVSSSRRADSAASRRSHASQFDEQDIPEEPQTVARQQAEINQGSISRPGSHGSRNRNDENQLLQSRFKRVGKVPGSFLSGPARRGRRRQSEEDAENNGELLPSSQDPDGQQADLIDLEPIDNLASSYYVPDRLASGSPVSAKNSSRPGRKRESPVVERGQESQLCQTSPDRDEIPIPHYKLPPPRPDVPSRHDQENEAPPTFRRNKALASSFMEKDMVKISAQPLSASVRPSSPERKALASLSQNTPRRAAPAPPPKMSILDAATSTAGAATTAQGSRRRNYMKVNGKCYTRIDSLGRGGSGKVYRVAADNGKMFALKRVSIEGTDENTVRGYKGEIDLLRKLSSVERVVTLYDYEMNEEKQILSLLMEMGELDFNTLLRMRTSPENAKFDPVFVRYYWQEMLECLSAVHAYDIVHSDLKPANFVLVQGRLKLIDFGIANAIQTDETVNVHRETQIGTPNYMSPESLLDSNAGDPNSRRISTNPTRPKLMKLGKPSDIWSLGCILYQMVYGTPPFGHIPNPMPRCQAIINWQYDIDFRDRGMGDVHVPASLIRTMKRCLSRDQHLRPTCEELLSATDPFLFPVETPEGSLPITEELLGRIIQSVVTRCRERMPTEAETLSIWPQAYWGSVAKAVGKDLRSSQGR